MATAASEVGRVVPFRRARGRVTRTLVGAARTPRGATGAVLAVFVLVIAFLGPVFDGASPIASHTTPYALAGGSHGLLGGDVLGRDVLARVMHGGSRLMLLAIASTALAIIVGTAAGVAAAYRGGVTNEIIMRAVDVLLGIPQLVFVLLLLSVIGPKTWLIILAVGLAQAPQVARVLHATAQDVSERDYVKAVAAWGVPPRIVIRRHVVPSLVTPLMVESGLRLSFGIVIIAGLSFLGLGTPPPNPDWGVMINENRLGLATNPWGVLAPAILLALLAVGVNTFTDAVARISLGGDTAGDPMLSVVEAEVGDTSTGYGVAEANEEAK